MRCTSYSWANNTHAMTSDETTDATLEAMVLEFLVTSYSVTRPIPYAPPSQPSFDVLPSTLLDDFELLTLLELFVDLELFVPLPDLPGLYVLGPFDPLLPNAGVCPSPPPDQESDGALLTGAIVTGASVGDFEGVNVGSFDRGAMVGDPAGRAGQNAGQAFEISACKIWYWWCKVHEVSSLNK